ncbi:Hypothetical predicted protein [Olea europaea subsp. europaea]|uniref:Uncharacterized protein n=1 Tax=Olea europaea subsp. europaea TaxID=158383 RepID=A0A8S0PLL4_OLEEU|nr:Hypothetical predicted protein [Olea europaea subsp. europaea]
MNGVDTTTIVAIFFTHYTTDLRAIASVMELCERRLHLRCRASMPKIEAGCSSFIAKLDMLLSSAYLSVASGPSWSLSPSSPTKATPPIHINSHAASQSKPVPSGENPLC